MMSMRGGDRRILVDSMDFSVSEIHSVHVKAEAEVEAREELELCNKTWAQTQGFFAG